MKKRIKRFFLLGFDKKTIGKFRTQIDTYNALALITANYALAVFMFLASIYVTVLLSNVIKIVMCLSMCLSGIISIIILKRNTDRQSHLTIEFMICWDMILCFICGIWMGSFGSDGRLAVSCVLIFAMIPVFFIRLPYKNIAILLPSVFIFWICSYWTKEWPIFLYDVLHSIMGMVCGVGVSWSLSHSKIKYIISNWQLQESNDALYRSSITDVLTGLPNRAKTMELLANMCDHPTKKYLVCMVLDIDYFKAYNDIYGHPEGDALLRRLGEVMQGLSQRTGLTLGRIGGEEFMALCETDSEDYGKSLAVSLRKTVEEMTVPHKASSVSCNVTVSIGLLIAPAKAGIIQKAYILADQALYRAKNEGRNCCWQYENEKESFSALEK